MRRCQGDFAECVKRIMPHRLNATAPFFGRGCDIYPIYVDVLRNNPVDTNRLSGIILSRLHHLQSWW